MVMFGQRLDSMTTEVIFNLSLQLCESKAKKKMAEDHILETEMMKAAIYGI